MDKALEHLTPIEVPAGWGADAAHLGAADHLALTTGSRTAAEFLNNVVRPMLAMEGDKLPVRCGPGGRAAQRSAGQGVLRRWWGHVHGCDTVGTCRLGRRSALPQASRPAHPPARLPLLCPRSVFPPGGVFPPGTTDIEKRSIATKAGWVGLAAARGGAG